MGGLASKMGRSLVIRPIQRYNIEERAEKVISREKPIPAPKFKSDQEFLEKLKVTNPQISDEVTKKDKDLLGRLQKVYVTSKDVQNFDPDSLRQIEDPKRPHPRKENETGDFAQDREQDYLWSPFDRTDLITKRPGKMNIVEIEDALLVYMNNPVPGTVSELAKKYDVDENILNDLVRYFAIFQREAPMDKKKIEELEANPYRDWEVTKVVTARQAMLSDKKEDNKS